LISRRSSWALCAALVAGMATCAFAIEYNEYRLATRLDGDQLHISAPNFNFLSGKSLQRLKDGASVAFIAQLTVSHSPNYVMADARSVARFAVSYDIWEERFSVTQIGDRSDQKRTISHLSAANAEAWCFDKLSINRTELPADKPFYVQLDMRVDDTRDPTSVIGETGISIASGITRAVEILSQPPHDKQTHWLLKSGPVTLAELLKGMRG
jgi:hypothetical protein